MHARLLDMLHDARDMHVLAVAERVDVDLDRAREVAVEQDRAVARDDDRLADVALEMRGCRARSPSRGRPARRRGGSPAGSRCSRRSPCACASVEAMPFLGCFRPSRLTSSWNRSRSSARSMASGEVPRIGMPSASQRVGELQRGLAAELHDHAVQRAVLLLDAQDLHHVLEGQRLEIEPVRGVVVGRHRLGVAVDHDRLVARVGQREAGVAAAVVELDPLPDPVRAAAEDDDLLAVARAAPRIRPRPSSGVS